MAVDALPLSKGRDLRLDLFRGLANWAIFVDHVPNNGVAWLTTRSYGFSDAADILTSLEREAWDGQWYLVVVRSTANSLNCQERCAM
jgi:hypothetical protein